MKIFYKNLAGYLISLEVTASDTIYILKQHIRRREGVPVFRQHLLLGGTTLEDCRLLSECNIVTHSTIDLKFRHYLVPSSSEMLEEEEMDPRAVDLAYSVIVGETQLWKANYHRKYQQWPLIIGTIMVDNLFESIVIQCETDVIVEKMGSVENLIVQLYKIKPLNASHCQEELVDGSLFIDKYNYLIKFTPTSTLTTSSSSLSSDRLGRDRETYKLVMNVTGYDSSSLLFETTGNVDNVNNTVVDVSRSLISPHPCPGQQLNEHMEATGDNVNNDLLNTVYVTEEAAIDRLCGEIKTQLLSGDSTTSGEEFGDDDDEEEEEEEDVEKSDDNVSDKPFQIGKCSSRDGHKQGVIHGRRAQSRRNKTNEESNTIGSQSIPVPPAVISADSTTSHVDIPAPPPSSSKSYLRMATEHLFTPASHKNPNEMIKLLDELGIHGSDVEQAEAMLVCM